VIARPALERPIGLLHATAMVVGIIVGVSIFVQPSEINRYVPSIPGVLSVWAVAGILTLFGALVCAELSSAFPRTGGVYVFLKETISPACGFLWGWAMLWSMHSGIIAASAVIFARSLARMVPIDDLGMRLAAIGIILLLSLVNYIGVRQGSLLQTIVTTAKIAAIVLILAMVVLFGSPAARSSTPAAGTGHVSFSYFVLAVGAGLFTFGGWHMVTYAAGETRNPAKTIPKALLIGVLTVTACYLALNAAYLYLLPLDKIKNSALIAADAAQALAGPRAAAAVSALVILSSLGVLNGVILAGPRTYFAMANEGLAFRWLAAIHPRFHTPYKAILLQAAWSCFLVSIGSYLALFTQVIYTEWFFFAVMTIGLFRLRFRPSYSPRFSAWGYPVVPLLFGVGALLVAGIQCAGSLKKDPWHTAAGLVLVVLGLPLYYLWKRTAHANH
jgi:basic amino acid/polyamine antiporter, APA family